MCRVLFIFFFAIVGANEWAFGDYVQLVARAKPAVVQLEVQTEDGRESGTGFFFYHYGLCVTASHVVIGALSANDISAKTNDGTRYLAQSVEYLNQDDDIAIIKFACPETQPFIDLGNNPALPAEGQTVLVIGNPERLTGTVSSGIVAAIREGLIQITAPVSEGSSGSPVLDESGHVIGVVVESLESGQNLNFAAPVRLVFKAVMSMLAKRERDAAIEKKMDSLFGTIKPKR
jgi:serine protease Do